MNMEFSASEEDEKDDVEPAAVPLSIEDIVPLPVTALDEEAALEEEGEEGVNEAMLRVPFDVKDLISVRRSKSSKNHLNVTLRGSASTSQVT